MENGEISYAGKYSAPDYETIYSADCNLAIENTMIYHTPEVKEQLEKLGRNEIVRLHSDLADIADNLEKVEEEVKAWKSMKL